jgi:hypothetical protein
MNVPVPYPVTDMAPPLAALQSVKLHCATAMLLPLAEIAPPYEVGLMQFLNATPVMTIVELVMLKAAPELAPGRRLQSKTVAFATPVMERETMLLMPIVGSL